MMFLRQMHKCKQCGVWFMLVDWLPLRCKAGFCSERCEDRYLTRMLPEEVPCSTLDKLRAVLEQK